MPPIRRIRIDRRRLLRCAQVSKMLDVSRKHVYRLIHQGDLEGVRISARAIRVTFESVDALLRIWKRNSPAFPDDIGNLRAKARRWRRRPIKRLFPSSDSERDAPSNPPRKNSPKTRKEAIP